MKFKVTGTMPGMEGEVSTTVEAPSEHAAALKARVDDGYSVVGKVEPIEAPPPTEQRRSHTALDPDTLAELDRLAEARLRRVFHPVLRVASLLWIVILTVVVLVGVVLIIELVGVIANGILDANSPYNAP